MPSPSASFDLDNSSLVRPAERRCRLLFERAQLFQGGESRYCSSATVGDASRLAFLPPLLTGATNGAWERLGLQSDSRAVSLSCFPERLLLLDPAGTRQGNGLTDDHPALPSRGRRNFEDAFRVGLDLLSTIRTCSFGNA
ncbi:hypothetical protein J7T55_012593 [Diaporthe amygdali]|uniref:uncharacterized protein n=1 Tax=Phomopsis amygdali TaxID=1214568 RepID=UPI0022FEE1DE|nr:uncharacterized protein J7T55_012593 [Diaporthe amygdali]KAJ0115316.1 hypothetical protein J7T55_012593 [Diaporthe amygdali]